VTVPPIPGGATPRSKDCLMLITVDPRDFETTAARIALVLAQPQWNEKLGVMAPLIFRDGRRAITLTEICGVIVSEPVRPWRLSYMLDQRVRFERIRRGQREPWHPKDAWVRRLLDTPYIEWIPPLSWHPEELRPHGRLPPGWSVVGWPNQLLFTDWT
jgi:hypothetical protein